MSSDVEYQGENNDFALKLLSILGILFIILTYIEATLWYIVGITILGLLIGYRVITSSETDDINTKSPNLLNIFNKYYKANRKRWRIVGIGLLVIFVIIAQSLIIQNTITNQQTNELSSLGTVAGYQANFFELETDIFEIQENSKSQIEDIFSDYNIDLIASEPFVDHSITLYFDSSTGNLNAGTSYINSLRFQILQQAPSFDKTIERTNVTADFKLLTVLPNSLIEINQTHNLDLTISDKIRDGSIDQNLNNKTVHIDYVWRMTSEDVQYLRSTAFDSLVLKNYLHFLSFPKSDYFDFLGDRTNRGRIDYYLNMSDLEGYEIDEMKELAEDMRKDISDVFRTIISGQPPFIQSELLHQIDDAEDDITNITVASVLMLTPFIFVSLLGISFISQLFSSREEGEISEVMSQRGISKSTKYKILILETMLLWVPTSIMATGVGFLSTYQMTNAVSFVSPENINMDIVTILQILAITLAISLLSRYNEFKGIEGNDRKKGRSDKRVEKSPPSRIISFIIGVEILYWIVARIDSPFLLARREALFNPIILIFMLLVLLLFPLLVSSYFKLLLHKLTTMKIIQDQVKLELSIRNMLLNKMKVTRFVLLLITILMLIFAGISFQDRYQAQMVEEASYSVGADMRIEQFNISQVAEIKSIEGVKSVTPIAKTIGQNQRDTIHIMGIDPNTFSQTAFWQEYYSAMDLQAIETHLKSNTTVLQYQAAEYLDLEENDDFLLEFENTSLVLDVFPGYTYFPNLVEQSNFVLNHDNSIRYEGISMVMNYDHLKVNVGSLSYSAYINMENGVDPLQLRKSLSDYLNIEEETIISSQERIDEIEETSSFSLYKQIINTMVITLIFLVMIFTLLYLSYYMFAMGKETKIYRSLGMANVEITSNISTSFAIIAFYSLITGLILGLFLSSNIFELFNYFPSDTTPPYRLTWSMNSIYYVVFALITLFLAVIGGSLYRNQNLTVEDDQ